MAHGRMHTCIRRRKATGDGRATSNLSCRALGDKWAILHIATPRPPSETPMAVLFKGGPWTWPCRLLSRGQRAVGLQGTAGECCRAATDGTVHGQHAVIRPPAMGQGEPDLGVVSVLCWLPARAAAGSLFCPALSSFLSCCIFALLAFSIGPFLTVFSSSSPGEQACPVPAAPFWHAPVLGAAAMGRRERDVDATLT